MEVVLLAAAALGIAAGTARLEARSGRETPAQTRSGLPEEPTTAFFLTAGGDAGTPAESSGAESLTTASVAPAGSTPTTLVLALDGIGYRAAAEARALGLLDGFRPPVPVVSTFPSLTSVAFTGMVHPLGYPQAPGYENRHYDWKLNKLRGGLPYIPFPWHEYLAIDHNGVVRKTLGYLWPWRLSRSDIERVFDAVLASPDPFITAYIANTDALVHMEGMPSAIDLLSFLHRRIPVVREAYRKRHGRELRVILISDHGQTAIQEHAVKSLKDHLARGGFRLQGKITDDRSVVIARFGYVEACMLYLSRAPEGASGQVGSPTGRHRAVRVRRRRRGSRFWGQTAGAPSSTLPMAEAGGCVFVTGP